MDDIPTPSATPTEAIVPPQASPSLSEAPESPVSDSAIQILLIGRDQPEGAPQSRSDALVLCTFQLQKKTVTMTSFLRDLYVQIPGYNSDRLNAAYAAGGTELLNETLQHNFDIQVDGNIEVDFSRFPKIIDLLGGVTLDLRQDEADAINKSTPGDLSAGTRLLNGQQALAYVRIRKLDPDGDFSRTARQRKLLEALLENGKNSSLPKQITLLKEILPIIDTNMSTETLIRLAWEIFPILSELAIKSQYIPAEGTYSYQSIQGMSVLTADLEAARKLLRDTLSD